MIGIYCHGLDDDGNQIPQKEIKLTLCPGCGYDYYHWIRDRLGCYHCTHRPSTPNFKIKG